MINPFSVVTYSGIIELSPGSDEWREVDGRTASVINGGTTLNTDQALNWNSQVWNWGGTPIESLGVGSQTNVTTNSYGSGTITGVNTVTSESTLSEVIGSRIVETTLAPWMRSRKVFFKVTGLRPNSRIFAYMDGNSLTNYLDKFL